MCSKIIVLQVGGGRESLPALKIAKSKGFKVVVMDKDPACHCAKFADFFIQASVYNSDEALNALINYNDKNLIAGVYSLGVDAPLTNSTLAQYLNLPCIPINAAKICSNKILMKDFLTQNGIKMPHYKEVLTPEEIMVFSKNFGFPLVVKPADSRGARGVLLIKNETNIKDYFEYAKTESPSKRVIIEKYCFGPQISSESIIYDGVSYTFGLSDRNYSRLEQFSPHIIEDGGELPSVHSQKYASLINSEIQKIANKLKIKNGTLKGDIVIENGFVKFIEVAPRLSGGYFSSHEILYSTGYNFLEAAINISVGIKPTLYHNDFTINKTVIQRYLFAKPGIIKKIEIPNTIIEDPNVLYFDKFLRPGIRIEQTTSHPNRVGVIITTGKNINDAVNIANAHLNSITIENI